VKALWNAVGSPIVNAVLFPSGYTRGICAGGGAGAGFYSGGSVCLVRAKDGQWGHIRNYNIGGVTGASAGAAVSFLFSDADSVDDLGGTSWDVAISGGEIASVGVDIDIGYGTRRQLVTSIAWSVGGGGSLTLVQGIGTAQVTTVLDTWR
jgi:hypothetical protein